MSLLYWRAQKWMQNSRCGLTSAEYWGRITSVNLLEVFCLMQCRKLLAFFALRVHWCLMDNLLSNRIPWSFLTSLLSSWSVRHVLVPFLKVRGKTLHLPFLIFMRSLFSPLLQPVYVKHQIKSRKIRCSTTRNQEALLTELNSTSSAQALLH